MLSIKQAEFRKDNDKQETGGHLPTWVSTRPNIPDKWHDDAPPSLACSVGELHRRDAKHWTCYCSHSAVSDVQPSRGSVTTTCQREYVTELGSLGQEDWSCYCSHENCRSHELATYLSNATHADLQVPIIAVLQCRLLKKVPTLLLNKVLFLSVCVYSPNHGAGGRCRPTRQSCSCLWDSVAGDVMCT